MISVIIPIYNRRDHLYLTLTALDCQGFRDFEVIVADDGSTDKPEEVAAFFSTLSVKYTRLERDGFGANRCRNAGTRVCDASTEAYLFLDSGILLNKHALQHYYNLLTSSRGALVVGGRYDWLPPMKLTPADIIGDWYKIEEALLPHSRSWNCMELQGIVGLDPRVRQKSNFFDHKKRGHQSNYFLELFGGNMLIPRAAFEIVGGFDETMNRHGGEDCEFAMRLQEAGIEAIFADEPIGYHMYHERDQEQNKRDVAMNIDYMRTIHDFEALGLECGVENELPLVKTVTNV